MPGRRRRPLHVCVRTTDHHDPRWLCETGRRAEGATSAHPKLARLGIERLDLAADQVLLDLTKLSFNVRRGAADDNARGLRTGFEPERPEFVRFPGALQGFGNRGLHHVTHARDG